MLRFQLPCIKVRWMMLNTEQYGRAMWQAYVNDGENPNGNALGYNYNWGYNANGNPYYTV